MAADKEGKFWKFHDLLFKDYNRLNDKKINEISASLNLNPEQFQREMSDPSIKAQINADIRNGNSAGVRGTPTVFVNGKLLRDRSLKGFKRKIDQAIGEMKSGEKSEDRNQ